MQVSGVYTSGTSGHCRSRIVQKTTGICACKPRGNLIYCKSHAYCCETSRAQWDWGHTICLICEWWGTLILTSSCSGHQPRYLDSWENDSWSLFLSILGIHHHYGYDSGTSIPNTPGTRIVNSESYTQQRKPSILPRKRPFWRHHLGGKSFEIS